jgi:hypothetical protein
MVSIAIASNIRIATFRSRRFLTDSDGLPNQRQFDSKKQKSRGSIPGFWTSYRLIRHITSPG